MISLTNMQQKVQTNFFFLIPGPLRYGGVITGGSKFYMGISSRKCFGKKSNSNERYKAIISLILMNKHPYVMQIPIYSNHTS